MKKWKKPEIIACFTKDELFMDDILADHTNSHALYNNHENSHYNYAP